MCGPYYSLPPKDKLYISVPNEVCAVSWVDRYTCSNRQLIDESLLPRILTDGEIRKWPIFICVEKVNNAAMGIDARFSAVTKAGHGLFSVDVYGEFKHSVDRFLEIEPEMYLGKHKVIFHPNGDINVGCQGISRQQLEDIYKKSTEIKEWSDKRL